MALSYADRRSDLKSRVLMGLAVTAEEPFGAWWEYAEELGLSEEALSSVVGEVQEELMRRAVRLARLDDTDPIRTENL